MSSTRNDPRALVRLEDVSYGYDSAPVLAGINLEVHAGDLLGVVGPSGSGKSTLLKAITGVVRPQQGRVVFPSGRVSIGYVPQVETINWYFPVTVLEVVLMGRSPNRPVPWPSAEERARALEVLEHLRIAEFADRHIRALSGGQQQRVFIARALLSEPALVLLDEPTSGVDVRTRHEVMHLLHQLHHEGIAIVFTTHDLNGVAAHMPEIVCLNRSVIAQGTPSAVLTSDMLERTYGAPMEVLVHGGMPVVVDTYDEAAVVWPRPGGHHEHPG